MAATGWRTGKLVQLDATSVSSEAGGTAQEEGTAKGPMRAEELSIEPPAM